MHSPGHAHRPRAAAFCPRAARGQWEELRAASRYRQRQGHGRGSSCRARIARPVKKWTHAGRAMPTWCWSIRGIRAAGIAHRLAGASI